MKHIAPGNNWTYCHYFTRDDDDTGAVEPATGESNFEAWLSLTNGGDEIHQDLRLQLFERVGVPGEYFAVLTGDVSELHLLDDDNELIAAVVYEVFGQDGVAVFSAPRRLVKVRQV